MGILFKKGRVCKWFLLIGKVAENHTFANKVTPAVSFIDVLIAVAYNWQVKQFKIICGSGEIGDN